MSAKIRMAQVTAGVVAIGGLLAAFTVIPDRIGSVCKVFRYCEVAEAAPVIPSYKTDWVTGGGGHKYCEPRLKSYQVQYPHFDITLTEPEGEHTSYHNPFKQDRYRYTCVFTATPKSKSG